MERPELSSPPTSYACPYELYISLNPFAFNYLTAKRSSDLAHMHVLSPPLLIGWLCNQITFTSEVSLKVPERQGAGGRGDWQTDRFPSVLATAPAAFHGKAESRQMQKVDPFKKFWIILILSMLTDSCR